MSKNSSEMPTTERQSFQDTTLGIGEKPLVSISMELMPIRWEVTHTLLAQPYEHSPMYRALLECIESLYQYLSLSTPQWVSTQYLTNQKVVLSGKLVSLKPIQPVSKSSGVAQEELPLKYSMDTSGTKANTSLKISLTDVKNLNLQTQELTNLLLSYSAIPAMGNLVQKQYIKSLYSLIEVSLNLIALQSLMEK